MALRVALVYNDPIPDRYSQMGEAAAVADVLMQLKPSTMHSSGWGTA